LSWRIGFAENTTSYTGVRKYGKRSKKGQRGGQVLKLVPIHASVDNFNNMDTGSMSEEDGSQGILQRGRLHLGSVSVTS